MFGEQVRIESDPDFQRDKKAAREGAAFAVFYQIPIPTSFEPGPGGRGTDGCNDGSVIGDYRYGTCRREGVSGSVQLNLLTDDRRADQTRGREPLKQEAHLVDLPARKPPPHAMSGASRPWRGTARGFSHRTAKIDRQKPFERRHYRYRFPGCAIPGSDGSFPDTL